MALTKKVASNAAFQVFGRVVQMVASTIAIILLSRYLGPTGYGFYALVLAFVALFSDISGFGINMALGREIPLKPNQARKIFGSALALKLFISLILFTVAVVVGILIYPNPELHWGFILAALSSFFLTIQVVYQVIFQIKLRIYKFVIADIVSRLIGLGLLIIFINQGLGLNFIIATLAIGSLINWLMTHIFACQIFPIEWRFDLRAWRSLIQIVMPLAGWVILSGVSRRIGVVILAKLKAPEAVGIYQLVAQPIILLSGLSVIFMGFVYPLMAKLLKKNREKLLRILSGSTDFFILAGLSLVGFILITNQHIVSILGGSEFMAATGPLKILALGFFLRLQMAPFQFLAIANHQEKTVLKIESLAFLLVVASNLILIPYYSYLGAAYSVLIFEFFLLTAMLIATRDFAREINWLRTIFNSGWLFLLSAVILWLIIQLPLFSIGQFVNYHILTRIAILLTFFLLFSAPAIYRLRGHLKELVN